MKAKSLKYFLFTQVPMWTLMAFSSCLFLGCERQTAMPENSSPPKDTTPQGVSNKITQPPEGLSSNADSPRPALTEGEKIYEERMRGVPPPPSFFPFPNPEVGPQRPPPIEINWYAIKDELPDYLLCQYDVDEMDYSQTQEPKWFEAALDQVRHSGPKEFPPIKWVAVMISNRAEDKDVSTAEQSRKVAAIFKAEDVFGSSRDLSQLVAGAAMDHHPFKYDPTQSTPGAQQRWMIVERHAATNNPATGPK
jgi:hypothetical protein